MSDAGSAFGRRSLALDGSEHGGRLTARRDGGPRLDLLIVAMLLARIALALATCTAHAEPAKGPPSRHSSVTAASSDPWSDHVAEAAKRFAIPERWIRAVMQAESVGDVNAVSPKGAMGLMQIMPATWAELRARHRLGDDPFKPRDNILAGAAYLREMLDRFGKKGFLAAYNAGPARYEQHLATGRPLPRETVDYVARLMPMIDGTVPLLSRTRRSADDHDAGRSPIFAQNGHGQDVDPAHVDRGATALVDTVFSTVGSPVDGSANSDVVTDLTAIASPPDHTSNDSGVSARTNRGSLFFRRSSGSTP